MGDVVVELRFAGDTSPDLAPVAVGGGRGCWRRSEVQRNAARCQIEAQVQKKKREGEEEARGRLCSPETEKFAGSNGGAPRTIADSLGAPEVDFMR